MAPTYLRQTFNVLRYIQKRLSDGTETGACFGVDQDGVMIIVIPYPWREAFTVELTEADLDEPDKVVQSAIETYNKNVRVTMALVSESKWGKRGTA